VATNRLQIRLDAVDKTRRAFKSIEGSLGRLRQRIFNLQNLFAGLGTGLLVKSFIDVGANVEQLRLRFAFLFRDVKEGDKAFNSLVKFASKVPFTLEQIQAGAGNLAVVTKNAEELNDIMKITGNVAAVTGLDFQTTAEQIQRSLSAGIGAADLFRDRGVTALLGFTAGTKVTVKQTRDALFKLFGKGGDFEEATKVLSTTFTGTLSMLSDKLFKFRLETGKAGFFNFVKQGLVEVNRLIEENDKLLVAFGAKLSNVLIEATKSIVLGSAVIIQALAPVFSFVGASLKNLFTFLQTLPEGVRTFGILGFLMLGGKGKALVLIIGGFLDKVRAKLGSFLLEFAEFNQSILEIRKSLGLVSDKDFVKILNQNNKLVGIATNLKKPVNEFKKELEATGTSLDAPIKKLREFLNTLEAKALLSQQQIEKLLNKLKGSNKEAGTLSERFKGISISLKEIAESLLEQANKQFANINEMIAKNILNGLNSISRSIAESIVLGKKLEDVFRNIAQRILIGIIEGLLQEFVIKKALLVIQKLLGLEEKKKEDAIKKQNAALQQQLGIQTAIAAISGFGGLFGGKGIPVAEGGQVKARADGGGVGIGSPYMVGERGRELFVPNQDGEIVSNERLQNLGATVNFTINATDVKGVKELLIDNRATIVNIINGALNQKGKQALV